MICICIDKCKTCGNTDIKATSKFCNFCGAKLRICKPDMNLPEFCYNKHPVLDMTIRIDRGVDGYKMTGITGAEYTKLNDKLGVSQKQAAAMLIGSIFGWDLPGARISDKKNSL